MNYPRYRAWHKEKKFMARVFLMDLGPMEVTLDSEVLAKHDFNKDIEKWDWFSIVDDIELMLYTNLKDKNGKEIYYGDIVKAQDGVWEIAYSQPWDGVAINLDNKVTAEMSVDFADNIYALNEVEIIGSIHENKELLTNKQNEQNKTSG